MEKMEYRNGTPPERVVNLLKRELQEKATQIIERAERKSLDHEEMREVEVGQNYGVYNFLR